MEGGVSTPVWRGEGCNYPCILPILVLFGYMIQEGGIHHPFSTGWGGGGKGKGGPENGGEI